jgi:hypothetical protein
MPRNIFLLEDNINLEDRLTFAWSWMLNLLPELGQAFCDLIADRTRLPKARFVSATDHPSYRVSDYPDMLLTTSGWRLIFEHKLGSPMNTQQLESYLSLAATLGKDTKLAFMSRDPWTVAPTVLSNPLYMRPHDHDHFLWTDIYPLVAACRSHAATDFEQYLARLGLRPENWGGIGDPFAAARPQITQVMVDASARLRRLGWPTRTPDERKWDAIEMPNPLPNIHLGYLKLKRTMGQAEPRVIGRAVELIVWTKPQGSERYLPRVTGRLAGSGGPIFVQSDWKNVRMSSDKKGELYFTAPMRDVLGNSYGSAVDGIASFADRVLTYVRDGGTILST